MLLAFRYRLYPTPDQEQLLRRTLGCCRLVYNKALALRSQEWSQNRKRISYVDLAKNLTLWKQDPELFFLSEVSNVALQQSLRHLDNAYSNFFEKRAKYPSFKKKHSGGSASFTAFGFRIKDGSVWLAKTSSPLKIVWSRPLPSSPSSCTVSLDPSGRWHISFLCDDPSVQPLPPKTKEVGLDMGLTALVTLSTGEKVKNHRNLRRDLPRLRLAQKSLSRKVKGSSNWRKQKRKVAKVYARVSDRRRDQIHKLTTRLVRENQVICIEDLNVRGMVRNRSLAKSISDAAWSTFKQQLEYKCKWYGRELIVVDRWFPSSKTCSAPGCGFILESLSLNAREWTCPKCGAHHDRDVNASRNILAAGLAVSACGETVRPKRSRSRRLVSAKQEPQP